MSSEIADQPEEIAGPPADAVEAFLTRRRMWVLVAVVAIACAARVIYARQALSGPIVEMHKWAWSDMNYFDHWARHICGGDVLCRNLKPPMHSWLLDTARAYLAANPDADAEVRRQIEAGSTDSPEMIVWQQWLGPRRFFQDPLYPYLVAAVYKLFGPQPRYMFILQSFLGILTIVLTYRLGQRMFCQTVAALAALLAALCNITLMYEVLLLRDSMVLLAGVLLVYLTDVALIKRRAGWWILLGLTVGLSVILKSIFNLYLMGLAVLVVARLWRKWRALGLAAAGLAVGWAMAMAPLVARNIAVGVPPLAVASNATYSFVQANAVSFDPEKTSLLNLDTFIPVISASHGQTIPAMVETLRTHPNAWSVLRMLWTKMDLAWLWWERPDNANIYAFESYAPILSALPVTFRVLAPLALVGMVISARPFARRAGLYLLVAATLAPMVLFNVVGRFRLPIVGASTLFAAAAVVQTVRWLTARQWVKPALAVAGAVLLALWTARPLPASICLVRPCDCRVPYEIYYAEKAAAAQQAGDVQRQADILQDFLRHEPACVSELKTSAAAHSAEQFALAQFFRQRYLEWGRALREAGDSQAALRAFGRAKELESVSPP